MTWYGDTFRTPIFDETKEMGMGQNLFYSHMTGGISIQQQL